MAPVAHFCRFLRAILGVHPNTFDTNVFTVEGALVDVPGSSRGDRLVTDN